jgi:AmmeMemoRadiSam system protein B
MRQVREPAVAGRFYPADPNVLRRDIRSFLTPGPSPQAAIACVVPHAGYLYSGAVAGGVFSSITIPPECIVLCPNHTGRGHPLAIMTDGEWQTPLGNVPLSSALGQQIKSAFPALVEDSAAHLSEHAIEVELPFLQILKPEIQFVPIAVGTGQLMILQELGKALAAVIRDASPRPLLVASSDMNHYEDDATTRVKDRKAIDKMLALEPRGLYETVMNASISMCGFGPAVAVLTAAVELGAHKAELVQYATSGDVTGDRNMVVGYAGVVIQ